MARADSDPVVDGSRNRSPARRLKYLLSVLALAIFIGLVQWYLGWSKLLAPWRLLSPSVAIGGLCVLLGSYVVRTLRFYSYFHDRMRGRLLLCTKLTWYHNFFNYVLPMRTGELAFPIFMARYFGVSTSTSVPVLVWFRMLDLHSLALVAMLALPLLDVPGPALIPLLISWLSLPWLAYRFNRYLAGRFRRARHPERWAWLVEALRSLPQDNRRFFVAWGWTLVNWSVKLAVVAFGIVIFVDTSGMLALAAAVAGEVSMVLPVHSVAATGTYEAGIAAVLVAGGVSFDAALAGAINLHLFLIVGILVTGIVAIAIPTSDDAPQDERRDSQ